MGRGDPTRAVRREVEPSGDGAQANRRLAGGLFQRPQKRELDVIDRDRESPGARRLRGIECVSGFASSVLHSNKFAFGAGAP